MEILPATAAQAPQRPDPAAKAAREFEAMALAQMFEAMFEGVRTDGAFGGGHAEGTWRSFMMQEYGRAVADQGGLGIARMVEADIARLYAQAGDQS
ncbi:rod-binding protein [Arenibaculum pallidiluteum]|uniref:rod-binding protein n=1 Tax=Arenibaculum pallidiluteum TaxID=2812559 RepID=UPI001A972C82|nr:rod-binding protein [Arenibaculum pallidiluteum]